MHLFQKTDSICALDVKKKVCWFDSTSSPVLPECVGVPPGSTTHPPTNSPTKNRLVVPPSSCGRCPAAHSSSSILESFQAADTVHQVLFHSRHPSYCRTTNGPSLSPSTTEKDTFCLPSLKSQTRVFDFSGNIIMSSTDEQIGCQCFMNLFDLRDPQIVLKKAKEHSRHINICPSVDLTVFISASMDNTAKLFDSAAISPIMEGAYGRRPGGHGSDHSFHQDWQV